MASYVLFINNFLCTLFRLIFIDLQNVGVISAAPCTFMKSIQNHTDGTLQHLVMKTNATPFMTLTMGWNLKWLMSRWCDSRSDNAATCHRICMPATQWAQPELRRCESSYWRFKHTWQNWLWQGRRDARSSWCIKNNYRVQLASSKHRASKNVSNSAEIIGLTVSPCRGNTSNATEAICSQAKQIQFRNCVSTPWTPLQKKYMTHQLEHKAKQLPTSSAEVKKISNLRPLHSYTHMLHSMIFTHTITHAEPLRLVPFTHCSHIPYSNTQISNVPTLHTWLLLCKTNIQMTYMWLQWQRRRQGTYM